MEAVLVVPALVAGVLLLLRAHRRNVDRLAATRDDLRRAGEATSPQDAALRAGGTSSWMRPGGS